MEIQIAGSADWECFLTLAQLEGWRVPAAEVELFRAPLAQCAFALREEGRFCGLITAVAYPKSGWIGNLLVPQAERSKGYGARLFDHAVASLQQQGVTTLWLTASEHGAPLYQRRGFVAVNQVQRWVLRTVGSAIEATDRSESLARLLVADAVVWGESRARLLAPLAQEATIFTFGQTWAMLQAGEGRQVLGPWTSRGHCPRENRQLLMAVLAAANLDTELVCDVLISSPTGSLLAAAGFQPQGLCQLMAMGPVSARLEALTSLASLGSIG
ncbi:MAG: GNAT family N-acetyltransferase [Trichloromonadaceae bacterium]